MPKMMYSLYFLFFIHIISDFFISSTVLSKSETCKLFTGTMERNGSETDVLPSKFFTFDVLSFGMSQFAMAIDKRYQHFSRVNQVICTGSKK